MKFMHLYERLIKVQHITKPLRMYSFFLKKDLYGSKISLKFVSLSFQVKQIVLKKLQVPPPDNPQKIYRCHLYVPLQRLHVPLMTEPPEVIKSFFSTSDGSLIRYLFKSYKHNVQIALGKLQMLYPDSSQNLTDVMYG